MREREVGVLDIFSRHLYKALFVLGTRKTVLLNPPAIGESGMCLLLASL